MGSDNIPRVCPFCESSCGLRLTVDGDIVIRIAGDRAHPASQGYLCAKSQGLAALRHDPDRLTRPLLRQGRDFREIDWPEALDRAAAGIKALTDRHGPASVATYTGNPGAHSVSLRLGTGALLEAVSGLHTNASAIDCFPRFLVDIFLYGNLGLCPVPDIDRTDFFIIFGGNPMVSNGSMMGAPDMPRRMQKLRQRGGTLVVVDPRRTETAQIADDHLALRPGTDALLGMALVHTLFDEHLVRLGALHDIVDGVDSLRQLAAAYTPERVADMTRISAPRIRDLARRFAAAPTAVAYGRVGSNCQSFGSLAIWAIDCLNILTGNLNAPGGAMFPTSVLPPFLNIGYRDGQVPYGRWRTRQTQTPEVGGMMPTQALWEEIETPGDAQIRGLVIVAGNPVLSNGNAHRVTAALERLDFMVAVDIYLNETTRHADIILPPMDHLKRYECTTIYSEWAVESVAAFSPAIFPRQPEDHDDWDILTGLAARLAGLEPHRFRLDYAKRMVASVMPQMVRRPFGLSAEDLLAQASGDDVTQKIMDILFRCGPFGDGFGSHPGGLTLDRMKQAPSGISFGPMAARDLASMIATPDARIAVAAPIFVNDLARLERAIAGNVFAGDGFLLINRRHIRSNNSWMHNLGPLAKGRNRCTAMLNPEDAVRLGVTDGANILIRSRAGEILIQAEISDTLSKGVVSVPHGWGEADGLARLGVAQGNGKANVNVLTDDAEADGPSGGASFNGVHVEVELAKARTVLF